MADYEAILAGDIEEGRFAEVEAIGLTSGRPVTTSRRSVIRSSKLQCSLNLEDRDDSVEDSAKF